MRKISITEIDGVRFGNAQNYSAMTGVTVIIFDKPNKGGIDVSGGGPAARESHLLMPLSNDHSINAIVLSGGSAFGLDASTGVMSYLEQHKQGYHILNTVVPLVCQSCIFDLSIGNPFIRPDAQMGYAACIDAENSNPVSGIIGAGTGATVGKVKGIEQGQKAGIGYYAVSCGELKVGAIVVVNAYGDIYNYKTGQKIAGMLNKERTSFESCEETLYNLSFSNLEGANTTLGVIITNADFSQADMNKVAAMARAAYGRCIYPTATMIDGDTIYGVSIGSVKSNLNTVGTLAATVLSQAIYNAIENSKMDEDRYRELCKWGEKHAER